MNQRSVQQLLEAAVGGRESAFAIVARSNREGADQSFVAVGAARRGQSIAELIDSTVAASRPVILAIPYSQIRERGFALRYGPTDLVAIECAELVRTSRSELLYNLPERDVSVTAEGFDLSDDQYMAVVQTVIDKEIGAGEGANFVLHRSYRGKFNRFDTAVALSAFRRLLKNETGAYWTFLIALPDCYLIGASPESHIEQDAAGLVRMNPISGTLRFGETSPTVNDYLTFLRDAKECEELSMVVDEELKIMSRIGSGPPRIKGPYLKEMSRLAHTEYIIEAPSNLCPSRIILESLPAPAVTGSPLENACRVIARNELTDRSYYSGIIAIVDPTAGPRPELDSAIIIRTAEVNRNGQFQIRVGATVVRHSDPKSEALETTAKASGLLRALTAPNPSFAEHPQIIQALRNRNIDLARFWIDGQESGPDQARRRRVVVVDYEDRFTDMLVWQLEGLGFEVTWRANDSYAGPVDGVLTILGPGPGDPTARNDRRIANLHRHLDHLLATRAPFLAICLSHQALSAALGLSVRRLSSPNQGAQLSVDHFGTSAKVAFYNTYSAISDDSALDHAVHGRIRVARLANTTDVIALRAERFESFQFHPESLLSADGHRLLRQALTRLADVPFAPGGGAQ